jgi:hypothetical protein
MSILRFLCILIVTLLFSGGLFAAFPEEAVSANQSLSAGHPAEALTAYQTLLASPLLTTVSSPELWYNRGLAEEKNGDSIAASLSYRRALLLDPTLRAARTRLTTVLSTLGIPLAHDWRDQLLMRVHPDRLIVGGAILGWLGILTLVYLLLRKPYRHGLVALALSAFVLGHGLSLFGTLTDPRRLATNQAVVTAKNAPTLHDTPADSAKADGTLAPGSFLTILSRNGAWWKVSNGTSTGWILSNTVTPILPSAVGL